MEHHPIPPEMVQEAEALLGQEMPADPKSKAFEQWLLQLYEEDAGLAAELMEHLGRKPTEPEAEPGVMEQERRRMQRQEALSRLWQRLWNVENQYGEWVPNQKRRLAAGLVAVALAFGVFLLVIGQKPLEEKKVQGNLGSISGLVAGQAGGTQIPGDTGPSVDDTALLPKASDNPQATTLLGASTGASTGASGGEPGTGSSTSPAGQTTPGFTTEPGHASSGSAPVDDFSPRVYPPAAPTSSAGAANRSTANYSPPATTSSASAIPADQPRIPSQPVPVMIRQPVGQLPTQPQYVSAPQPSPTLVVKAASTSNPEAMQGNAGATPTTSRALPKPTPLALQNQTPSAWQAVRPTVTNTSLALANSTTSSASVTNPPAQPLTVQGGPSSAGTGYAHTAQPTPQNSGAVAYSRPTQPTPTNGQMVQLSRAAPPALGSAQSPEAPASAPPADVHNTGQPVSPLSLPSLQTPTNLAQGFLAGLDPSKPLEATLDTNLLLVEGVSVLARAVTAEGTVWLGQASLDPLRRVGIQFKEVIQGGQRIPVSALAYDAEHSPGLAAEFRDENPSLVQDLLRQGAQAANGYLQSLLQASQTTAVPGGGAVQDRSAPPLEWVLLGELGKLFTLPQPQNSFVRTARVAKGTPLLIYLSPTK